MFVSTMKPQPARVLWGTVGWSAATSVRAPSMKTAKPTKICAAPPQLGSTGATSAPNAARHTITRSTPTSSSAQPVNGIAPVTPVVLSRGVSTKPNGLADVPFGMRFSVTAIGPAVVDAPASVNVIAPVTLLPIGNPPTNTILTDRLADPLPDAGLTCSHGWFDTAVHVTVPGALPACVSRTTCAAVCDTKAAPVVSAANRSDVLSGVSVRGVAGLIVSVYAWEPAQPLEPSVAVTVSGNDPVCVGVPASTPALERVTPVGSELAVANVTTPRAPDVVKVVLYGTPAIPAGSGVVDSVGQAIFTFRMDSTIEPDPVKIPVV